MKNKSYKSMTADFKVDRRDFLKTGIKAGLLLGTPTLWAQEKEKAKENTRIKTNIDDVLKIPKTKYSLPGLFPGKVVEIHNEGAMKDNKPDEKVIS
ncbi:MAG: hypothetical protein L0Y73_02230, partial [Candidatus Aminicenantes bacterium]|nr:hypothetical protein [Candidatus Aminicenantes bacterium]